MDSTVVKAFSVLEALANSDKPSRITDLALELGLAKSNTHRLLKTLEALGYVRQRSEDGLYEASLRLWETGVKVLSRLDLREIARPWLLSLAKETGETVHLSRFDNGEAVYLDKIESTHAVRAYTQIGGRSPAYATATGKALLAHQSEAIIASVATNLIAFTPRTLIDENALRTHLAAVRRNGYATNLGEWRASVYGLGAPIFNEAGAVVAAVGISGLDERLRGKALSSWAPAVTRAAFTISRELGYALPEKATMRVPGAAAAQPTRKADAHATTTRRTSARV
jgi:IclR family KDG regulon transcriptional repressor